MQAEARWNGAQITQKVMTKSMAKKLEKREQKAKKQKERRKKKFDGVLSFKGVVDWFFSRLDCVYGVQSSMFMLGFFKNALFFT